jgi:hypothetical protein
MIDEVARLGEAGKLEQEWALDFSPHQLSKCQYYSFDGVCSWPFFKLYLYKGKCTFTTEALS